MQQDSSQGDRPVPLASGTVATAVQPDTAVALPRLGGFSARISLPFPRVALRPAYGYAALATMLLGTFAIVAFAAAGPSVLVPASVTSFPHWFSGPLHGLFGHLDRDAMALTVGFSSVMVVMTIAYGIALASVRMLSMRTIAICVVALHAIVFLTPPLPLTDVFNYLGYARLGALHGLNPYTHVIAEASHDPVSTFVSWHHLPSPYGEAFTALTYPLAFLSLPVAFWVLKAVTMLASLGVIALVWRIARQLGRDPRFAVLFVALNPIVLIYAMGGFHNDYFMLLPALGAVSLLLARHDRSAGAMVVLAVAVKFTAIILLPFLLLAAVPALRRRRVLTGVALAAVPLIAGSIALFGFSLPNLSDQSTLLTNFSIPNVFGLLLGTGGGAPGLLRVANVALVLAVALLLRRRGNWLNGAGWATFALIASLAWLVPWYVIWLLPLAALGTSLRLRRVAVVFTAYLVLTFMPLTGVILGRLNYNPLGSSVGQASTTLQHKLEQ